jgi:hypothetical protein
MNEYHGGKRKGAGRPSIGVTKKMAINLRQEDWDKIDQLKLDGHIESVAQYFRTLHEMQYEVIKANEFLEQTKPLAVIRPNHRGFVGR